MNVNKAILVGRITNDLELKKLPSGNAVTSFSLATNKTYTDNNGNKQEKVEFHNVVVFGKTAENVARYMTKGSQIFIEGELQTRNWEDKDTGKKMYRTEIVAQHVQFGAKPGDKSQGGSYNRQSSDSALDDFVNDTQGKGVEFPDDEINPEDIPF